MIILQGDGNAPAFQFNPFVSATSIPTLAAIHYRSYYSNLNGVSPLSQEFPIEYKFTPNTDARQKGYRNDDLSFILQVGDEIRMISSSSDPIIFTIDSFDVPGSTFQSTASVFPNPQDFELPLTSSFTIRRRIDQDNKVILKNIPFIKNTLGISTPSSDGFLIPEDFTQENKDKVGKIIAILKGNNIFT